MALIPVTAGLLAAVILGRPLVTRSQQIPAHQAPSAKNGGVVVMLCDGKTSVELKGAKAGQQLSRAQGMTISRELMAHWQREHPNERWQMAQVTTESAAQTSAESYAQASPAASPGAASGLRASPHSQGRAQQGDTYASFTNRDFMVWKAETEKFVAEGKRIFHSDKELGGTIGVSCDMCHPDASNTHPETYPKYQVQLQRVALLRDMIDWCIENPVKGKAFDPNDPKLRALEAYIYAQRKGVALEYGKH